VRKQLKELSSAFEEAKAAHHWPMGLAILIDKGVLD
jgi:hypothetical protein